MLTGPALKTLTAALCTGGALAVATAGPAAAAVSAPTAPAWGDGGVIWGTVVSATELNLRRHPDTGSAVVHALAPGSQERIQCKTTGSLVGGTAYWYWFTGAHGWASAAFVDTGGQHVPTCSDPCPGWKSGDGRDGGGGRHDSGDGRHDSGRHDGGRNDGGRNDGGSFYFRSESTLEFGFTFG